MSNPYYWKTALPTVGTRIEISGRAFKLASLKHQVDAEGLERCELTLVYQELPRPPVEGFSETIYGTDIGPEPEPQKASE